MATSRLLFLALGMVLGIGGTVIALHLVDDADIRLTAAPDQFSAPVAKAIPGAPYTYAATQVCLDRPGLATITDVRVSTALHDVEVAGFAVTAPQAVGTKRQQDIETYVEDLQAVYTSGVTKHVTTTCSDDMDVRDVVVEVKAPVLPAVVTRVDIDYRVGARTRTITTRNALVLCSGTAADQEVDELSEGTDLFIASCDR